MIYLAKGINCLNDYLSSMEPLEIEYSSMKDFLFLTCKNNPFLEGDKINFRGYIVLLGLKEKIGNERTRVKGLELIHAFDNIYCLFDESEFRYSESIFLVRDDGIYINGVNIFDSMEDGTSKRLDYIDRGSKYCDSYIYYPNSLISRTSKLPYEFLSFLENYDGELGPISEEGLPEFFYMTSDFNKRMYLSAKDVKEFKLRKFLDNEELLLTYNDGTSESISGNDIVPFLSCCKKYSSLPKNIYIDVIFNNY